MRRWVVVLTLLAATACGGGSAIKDVAPDPTPPATVPPTSAVPVTAPPSTLAPTTTAPPTTEVPTTTIPVENQIRQAVQDDFLAYKACLADPAACDPASFRAGVSVEIFKEDLSDMVDAGYYIRDSSDDPSTITVGDVRLDPSGTRSFVNECIWDTLVVYGPSLESGGAPSIVNDLRVSQHRFRTLERVGDRWLTVKIEDGTDRTEETNVCAAS